MNWIGFLTLLIIIIIAWLCGVVSWSIGVYHMLMFQFCVWQARPKLREMVAKTIFLMRHVTLRDFKEAWQDVPTSSIVHRQKAIKWGIRFAGFVLIGLASGTLGTLLGGGWGSPSQP